ncbi:MliC family protein [Enterovibrio makurazakiensis]|uniref:MliC family protein n=1 Tax=Enterovibrio gelatinilyticus TaxID=2899819 RepID=A0ABT5R357_9GAMM|nr:MliC family protein [Enterovibrio sp. ZSDZ42]MDD1794201.1 MliC family protein [Enterovibrio sp. ZSDZ42]
MKKLFSILLVSLFVTACSSSLPHQYACEGEQTFDAMVTSDSAVVRFNDEELFLPRIRSASGAQWESEDKLFGLYTKADEAMLVWGDSTLRECVLVK